MQNQSSTWYTPEENMPPNDKPVLLEIEMKYGIRMHTYGKFNVRGWDILANVKEFTVIRWRYFCEGEIKIRC